MVGLLLAKKRVSAIVVGADRVGKYLNKIIKKFKLKIDLIWLFSN